MPEPLLSLDGVHTHIDQYHILQGVTLEVPAGGVSVLLGRNGAGKTTTLRTIMGLWHASSGTIRFDGRDITALATPDIARLGIAYVPENMGIFSDLTVRENLVLAATSGPLASDRLASIVLLAGVERSDRVQRFLERARQAAEETDEEERAREDPTAAFDNDELDGLL